MQRMHMKVLIFLGAIILCTALFMKTAVISATASRRVNFLVSTLPSRDVIVLPAAGYPMAVPSHAQPIDSLASFTWENLVSGTFQAENLLVVQLSQIACYACHLETKISCLYNIQPYVVSSCTNQRAKTTGPEHDYRMAQNIVDCSSCHGADKSGFAWQASIE